jgi:hypothetical protein
MKQRPQGSFDPAEWDADKEDSKEEADKFTGR